MVRYYAKVKLSEIREFEIETRDESSLRKLIDDMTNKFMMTDAHKTKLSS